MTSTTPPTAGILGDTGPTRSKLARDRLRAQRAVPGQSTGPFWALLAVVVVINMIGLIMVLSSSAVKVLDGHHSPWSFFQRQVAWAAIGSVALVFMLYVGHRLRRYAGWGLTGAVVLLALVLVPGVGITANGAARWLGVGPLQVQPSELAKLALILLVADRVDHRQGHLRDSWRAAVVVVRPVMLALGAVAGLVMLEPNLGTTIVLVSIVLLMLFAVGAPPGCLARWTAGFVAFAVFAVVRTPWRVSRLMAYRNPWAHADGSGYQTLQSQTAAAGGGWFGRGLGDSRAKWNFLPEAHTDFIYAVMAEELGLVGAVCLVVLFLALAGLGVWVACRARTTYDMLVAVGVTGWLVVQGFVNIGATVGILPVTGVPLPFVSFGGSSLLVTLAATGLLLSVARHPTSAPARPQRA